MTCLIAWSVGVSLGAYISGGISGGHINPAVTVALAAFRGFSWAKVPRYVIAQTLGCMAATFVVYQNYSSAIAAMEHGSGHNVLDARSAAGNFISIPADGLTPFGAWFDEFLGTAILVGYIFVFTDSNLNPPSNLPFAVFLLVAGIAAAFGSQTGFAINPARDFGPRLALTVLGYGSEIWTHNSAYWSWGIWASTIPGALVGGLAADAFLFTGSDSKVNRIFGGAVALPQ
ncbi:hypothetical protein CBS101457_001338 [Exobasidium rhododendri]|nr:hypothetical protein CBS101457_001338 [Exobasidium rhododendri]